MPVPRVAKAQPWAGIGERFQRYSLPMSLSKMGIISTFCAKLRTTAKAWGVSPRIAIGKNRKNPRSNCVGSQAKI
jgi:hypothetical protein